MVPIRRKWKQIARSFGRRTVVRTLDIAPDEIFLDSSNLPKLDEYQFEGRVETPMGFVSQWFVGILFVMLVIVFGARAFYLQIVNGALYTQASENNRLDNTVLFGERGVVYDRNGTELAWNEQAPSSTPYSLRTYTTLPGLSHLLGYVRYPKSDTAGTWWRTDFTGITGVEQVYDDALRPTNGKQMSEVDARGVEQSGQMIEPAVDGKSLMLSVDATMSSKLYELLSAHAEQFHFRGGAAVIMDVHTGEIVAMTSFPEYSSQAMTNGSSTLVHAYTNDPRTPFLDRVVAGAYTPGSIVKPLFAAAALTEGIISPDKKIFSPGYITIPNPYHPDQPTIIHDWRAHGWTDMREAISVSSDVYFFSIGGGYQDQVGLGIQKIDEWAREFGLGSTTGIALPGEMPGVIPTPTWKKQLFGDTDTWKLGDTYNTSIGQYGFQVTPIQVVRYVSALANGGTLYDPHIIKDATPAGTPVKVTDANLQVIREGMRLAVTSPLGTEHSLNMDALHIAGKTGTAQLGTHNEWMNSWAIGFWPYEHPKYAFAVLLEHAPAGTLSGSAPAMIPFFSWLVDNEPQYAAPTSTPAL